MGFTTAAAGDSPSKDDEYFTLLSSCTHFVGFATDGDGESFTLRLPLTALDAVAIAGVGRGGNSSTRLLGFSEERLVEVDCSGVT